MNALRCNDVRSRATVLVYGLCLRNWAIVWRMAWCRVIVCDTAQWHCSCMMLCNARCAVGCYCVACRCMMRCCASVRDCATVSYGAIWCGACVWHCANVCSFLLQCWATVWHMVWDRAILRGIANVMRHCVVNDYVA